MPEYVADIDIPPAPSGGRVIGRAGRSAWVLRRLVAAVALALLMLPAGAPPAAAQAAPAPAAQADTPAVQDPFGRSTPAGTIDGFIDAIAAGDYRRAAEYLEVSRRVHRGRTLSGQDLARLVHRALDREGNLLPDHRLSGDAAGHLADNLAPDLDSIGSLGAGDRAAPFLLRQVTGDGGPHWVVAAETVAAALDLRIDDLPGASESWLPPALTDTTFAGAPVSHWLTLLGLTLAVLVAIYAGLRVLLLVLGQTRWRGSRLLHLLRACYRPLALLAALMICSTVAPALGISIVARLLYASAIDLVAPLVVGWISLRLIDVVSDRVLAGLERYSRATASSVLRFAVRFAKAVVVALVVLAMLDAVGFDVTAVLATLGIGGLALALGAQRTVENLIASVSIISDRPFRVGDFCKIGGTMGTVEDIGMRSTRIRTLDRTMVTIPNSNLVSSEIENFAGRDRFWFKPVLHVPTDTPPEKIRALLADLRSTLDGDPRLLGGSARVRMLLPADDRLPIEVFGYVLTADGDTYLAIQEELALKLLDTVAAHGLALAPPTLDLRPRHGAAGT